MAQDRIWLVCAGCSGESLLAKTWSEGRIDLWDCETLQAFLTQHHSCHPNGHAHISGHLEGNPGFGLRAESLPTQG